MNIQELKNLINRIVGTKGNLRITPYWLQNILLKILSYIDYKINLLLEKISKIGLQIQILDKKKSNNCAVLYNNKLQDNYIHIKDSVYSLTLEVPMPKNTVEHYIVYIKGTKNLTFKFDENISYDFLWANGLEPFFEEDKCYELSIVAVKINDSYCRYKACCVAFF